MCKPNMISPPQSSASTAPDDTTFFEWKGLIEELAAFKNTYMKISGGFSEIVPLPKHDDQSQDNREKREEMFKRLVPHIGGFISTAWDAFGADRVLWASDWPVCNIGGGGNEPAWKYWLSLVEQWANGKELSDGEKKALWSETASKVYKIPTK